MVCIYLLLYVITEFFKVIKIVQLYIHYQKLYVAAVHLRYVRTGGMTR
jgi:hypothetical protein